jgi:hypothetical protein
MNAKYVVKDESKPPLRPTIYVFKALRIVEEWSMNKYIKTMEVIWYHYAKNATTQCITTIYKYMDGLKLPRG